MTVSRDNFHNPSRTSRANIVADSQFFQNFNEITSFLSILKNFLTFPFFLSLFWNLMTFPGFPDVWSPYEMDIP